MQLNRNLILLSFGFDKLLFDAGLIVSTMRSPQPRASLAMCNR
jgi:hypothetical protein